jgi:hypothetical protein
MAPAPGGRFVAHCFAARRVGAPGIVGEPCVNVLCGSFGFPPRCLDVGALRRNIPRMLATDTAIRDLLEEIHALLANVTSTRFVPYWSMRSRAFARVMEGWSAQPPSPEQREALHEAVLGLRSEIMRSSGQAPPAPRARAARLG